MTGLELTPDNHNYSPPARRGRTPVCADGRWEGHATFRGLTLEPSPVSDMDKPTTGKAHRPRYPFSQKAQTANTRVDAKGSQSYREPFVTSDRVSVY
jgi:hypothetical protein